MNPLATQTGRTWVVVADGRRARFFEEPARGVPLRELEDLAMAQDEQVEVAIRDRPARSFDRVGPGRHAMTSTEAPRDLEKERFLGRVAERIDAAVQRGAFEHLSLIAPPRALGRLRESLTETARRRITIVESKDRVTEDAADIAAVLRAHRSGA